MATMTHQAPYDEHADWYATYLKCEARDHTARTADALRDVLRAGKGLCVDMGCGTGIHGDVIRSLGWTPVGVDVSIGQLRHALAQMPVVLADATHLPLRSGSVDATAATLIHTDVADWAGTVAEVARILRGGGRFAYVGVHPCFVGPFAERGDAETRLYPGYWDRELTYSGPGIGVGIRPRVGVRHRTLSDLLSPLHAAGLTLEMIEEIGSGALPDLLAFAAVKRND